VRREIADALPRICEMLLRKSVEGDTTATKLLWQMAMLDQKPAVKKPGARSEQFAFAGKTLRAFQTEMAKAMGGAEVDRQQEPNGEKSGR
jgi:hypothetical protein